MGNDEVQVVVLRLRYSLQFALGDLDTYYICLSIICHLTTYLHVRDKDEGIDLAAILALVLVSVDASHLSGWGAKDEDFCLSETMQHVAHKPTEWRECLYGMSIEIILL